MLSVDGFEKLRASSGSNPGGVYQDPTTGQRYHIKRPRTERQAVNEVMASTLYAEMGFDALQYEFTTDGRIASKFREGLPERSGPDDLIGVDAVMETFLPSIWIANFDVFGLVYDNLLYEPPMPRPVLLDFGGAFDTRAQGGSKPFPGDELRGLEGFLDPSINSEAHRVYQHLTFEQFESSKDRVLRLHEQKVQEAVLTAAANSSVVGTERVRQLRSRQRVVEETEYDDLRL